MAAGVSKYAARTVVVTGSRKGLGKAIASHFLAEGAQVVGISRGTATWEHERYLHLQADIGDDRAVRAAFTRIARTFKKVDILVNNAAVLESIHALLMPAAKAEEMVRTNLLGTLFASREAAKLMQRAKWGRIINIGSMAVPLEPIGDSAPHIREEWNHVRRAPRSERCSCALVTPELGEPRDLGRAPGAHGFAQRLRCLSD